MSTLHTLQEQAADNAFESYDFGPGVRVEETGSWDKDSYDGQDDWCQVVYVTCDDDAPDADSQKVSFHVKFKQGTTELVEAYAYWCSTGAELGQLVTS